MLLSSGREPRFDAEGRIRTSTPLAGHQLLGLGRLPVTPLPQFAARKLILRCKQLRCSTPELPRLTSGDRTRTGDSRSVGVFVCRARQGAPTSVVIKYRWRDSNSQPDGSKPSASARLGYTGANNLTLHRPVPEERFELSTCRS